jgi:hypothetical protein
MDWFIILSSVRIWWNWQTRYFEVVVGQPVQVQVLLCAPTFSQGKCWCFSFRTVSAQLSKLFAT